MSIRVILKKYKEILASFAIFAVLALNLSNISIANASMSGDSNIDGNQISALSDNVDENVPEGSEFAPALEDGDVVSTEAPSDLSSSTAEEEPQIAIPDTIESGVGVLAEGSHFSEGNNDNNKRFTQNPRQNLQTLSSSAQGKFIFAYVDSDGVAHKFNEVNFDKFSKVVTMQIPADVLALGDVILQVYKSGGGLAFTDFVSVDNRLAISNSADSSRKAYIEKKLANSDLDVLEIKENEPLDLTFSNISSGTLQFTGRIEEKIVTGDPFELGVHEDASRGSMPNLNLNAISGSVALDGQISPLNTANATVFDTKPTSGHPDGKAFIWTLQDANNYYFIADWTSDNTFDYGDDFFAVHIGDGVNAATTYKQTSDCRTLQALQPANTKNIQTPSNVAMGEALFTYTDTVVYEHMYYKIVIPRGAIPTNAKVGYELYGTATQYQLGLSFNGQQPDTSAVRRNQEITYKLNYKIARDPDSDPEEVYIKFIVFDYTNASDNVSRYIENCLSTPQSCRFGFRPQTNPTFYVTYLEGDEESQDVNIVSIKGVDRPNCNFGSLDSCQPSVMDINTSFSTPGLHKIAFATFDSRGGGYTLYHAYPGTSSSVLTGTVNVVDELFCQNGTHQEGNVCVPNSPPTPTPTPATPDYSPGSDACLAGVLTEEQLTLCFPSELSADVAFYNESRTLNVRNISGLQDISEGDSLSAYIYSEPVRLGEYKTLIKNSLANVYGISIPNGYAGEHKLALYNAQGQALGWVKINLDGNLANTGLDISRLILLFGVLILFGFTAPMRRYRS